MAPLMTGLNDEDVRWDKFKNSYMYNDTYYLRRTKFIIYQCATTSVGIASGLAGRVIHNYNHGGHQDDYPSVIIDSSAIIAVMGLTIAASGIIGIVFTPAIFFDLFWPERWEAPVVQRLWKWSAMTGAVTQLAAAIASTVVIATSHLAIKGGNAEERAAARVQWSDKAYHYREPITIVCVVFAWVGAAFAIWSTAVMWMAYWHNNKYGPFSNHIAKRDQSSGIITEESDLTDTV